MTTKEALSAFDERSSIETQSYEDNDNGLVALYTFTALIA